MLECQLHLLIIFVFFSQVINALAKSGEPSAAARAERVLHNMVNRHRHGASEDVKPTTINFNSVLDAWAKSGLSLIHI